VLSLINPSIFEGEEGIFDPYQHLIQLVVDDGADIARAVCSRHPKVGQVSDQCVARKEHGLFEPMARGRQEVRAQLAVGAQSLAQVARHPHLARTLRVHPADERELARVVVYGLGIDEHNY